MIIKLIQPKMLPRPMDTKIKTRMAPSLALLTIAAIIPKEHGVLLENENIRDIDFDQPVDLVGITVTVDTMPRAIQIAKRFQSRGIPVVAGGIHITADVPGSQKYFDALAIGMGEATWPQIIADAASGQLQPIYMNPNHCQKIKIASPRYDLAKQDEYLYTNIVSTSRGCPFHCDFCYNSSPHHKSTYVNRPIQDVLEDIKTIRKKHIMFIDDNFVGNPAWTREFLHALMPLGLKWNAAVSANIIDMPDILDLMKESGCQSLFIGFESLNQNALQDVHKMQNHSHRYDALVHAIHERGIMINASFVFGLDGDDATTFASTLDWIVKNKIETVTSHILTPYPGTKLYEEMLQSRRITDFDLSHYNTAHVVYQPANMTPEELYAGYLWIYKELYSFKNILKRIPEAPNQRMAYLAFNLLYRKFGPLTDWLCGLISYRRFGKIGEWLAYKLK